MKLKTLTLATALGCSIFAQAQFRYDAASAINNWPLSNGAAELYNAGMSTSNTNLSLTFNQNLPSSLRFTRLTFRDYTIAGWTSQATMVSHSSNYSDPNFPNRANDLAFRSYVSGGQDYVFDGFKVGIGTYSPKSNLHIAGSGQSLTLEANSNLSGNSQATDIVFENASTPNSQRDWVIRSYGPNHTSFSKMLSIWSPEQSQSKVYFGDKDYSLKMGINTLVYNYGHSLNLTEGIHIQAVQRNGNPDAENVDITLRGVNTGGDGRDWVIRSTGKNHTATPEILQFWAPNFANPRVYFPNNTKVSIGVAPTATGMPGNYQLYVAGGILTEELKVALKTSSAWSDYVFEKDFNLKSLSEVEDFISENGHLPDVPSAEELVEDGINVAEMDAILLQKIEELTLYIIDMKKELNQLKGK